MSETDGVITERERFSIHFDGPALAAHSLDVRQLAPSLLALADLFVIAHAEAGATLTRPPALEVTAERGGSFIVDLWLAVSDAEESLTDLLSGARAAAAANGAGITAAVIGSIAWLVHRRRKGREQSVQSVDPGRVRINWADGTSLEAPVAAQQLVERMDYHRVAGQVFEPLRKDGIDSIELRRELIGRSAEAARVERDDLRAFNVPPEDDVVLSDNTRIVTVSIVNLPLKTDNKWRLNDGSAVIWATLDDNAFRSRMDSGVERFGVGDQLRVQMRDQQLRTAENGITVEHSIQRVIEHRSVPPPEELPFADD